jgi:4-amino-4-deoxy-L-arabinose transferase-like glycosyltransferase
MSEKAMRRLVVGAFLVGLLARVIAIAHTGSLGAVIVDEQHYTQLAGHLARGDGFVAAPGQPTSIRPPLYPAFIASVWWTTGTQSLQAVRIAQCLLSLVTAALVYALGRRLYSASVGAMAAAAVWVYPSLIYLNVTILGETLFTLLLVAFVLATVALVDRPRLAVAVAAGALLGAAALTRSVVWPLPVLLCPLLLVALHGPLRRRAALSVLVLAGYAVVVGPWAVRNTRLQQVLTVVDTMGGMNLRMGNYEYTPEHRMWDAVSMKGEQNWAYALSVAPEARTGEDFTEGMKDKWAQRKALEYMLAHPGTTVRRSLIKFADFWGLERSFAAGVSGGLYHPPIAWTIVLPITMIVGYVGVALLGAAGMWLAAPAWRPHLFVLLPMALITGIHSLVFGHERYHLPLVPFLALYASALVWSASRSGWFKLAAPSPAAAGALLSIAALIVIWCRQLFVEGERVRALLERVL